eukprot:998951-Rhodomonas_salina.3
MNCSEILLLRHENALLERINVADKATGELARGVGLGGDPEVEQGLGAVFIDLAKTQAQV